MHFGCLSTAMFMNVLRYVERGGRESRWVVVDLATFNYEKMEESVWEDDGTVSVD